MTSHHKGTGEVNTETEPKCKHENCEPMSHRKKRCLDCRAIIYEDYEAYCDD